MSRVLARFEAARKKHDDGVAMAGAIGESPPNWQARGMRTALVLGMKKDETIDALELLADQHEEVDSLIEEIEDSDDPSAKDELFRKLADSIAAHAEIEEKIFYPSVMHESTRDLLLESTEEHLVVKRTLADMMELDVDDERFDAKLTVLKESLRHHAHDEEEDTLFPKVRKLLDSDQLAALGNEILAMYDMLLERGEPRRAVQQQTAEAAQLM
jgi:hemerythrin superfamily protein